MDLDSDEIEERISFANDIDSVYLWLFLLIDASIKAGEEIDIPFFKDMLQRFYGEILSAHGINTDNPYINDYVDYISDSVLQTTNERITEDYYLSNERAREIAVNDANAINNFRRHLEAIREGKTYKVWITSKDNLVRKTHKKAHWQKVEIQEPFIVGESELMFPLDYSLDPHPKECINWKWAFLPDEYKPLIVLLSVGSSLSSFCTIVLLS